MDSLVNYLQPFTFQAFDVSQSINIFIYYMKLKHIRINSILERNRSFELSSFVETNAFNLLKEKSTDFVK